MAALALAGIGIGTTVVPVTLIGAVRSAAGTLRHRRLGHQRQPENGTLTARRGPRLARDLPPAPLQSDRAAQSPGHPGPVSDAGHRRHRDRPDPAEHLRLAGYGKIVQEVVGAAYASFHDGLHAALYVSAGLALAAGLLAFFTLRSRPAAAETLTFPLRPSHRDSGQP